MTPYMPEKHRPPDPYLQFLMISSFRACLEPTVCLPLTPECRDYRCVLHIWPCEFPCDFSIRLDDRVNGRVDGSTLLCQLVMLWNSTSHVTPAHEQPGPPELSVISVWG